MSIAAVIVAAGRGTRAGAGLPKQWRMLAGRSVAARSVAAFRDHPAVARVVLVVHPEDRDRAEPFAAQGIDVVAGGADRAASVRAGLDALQGSDTSRVLIHDVARPCIDAATIDRVIAALDTAPGAAPAIVVSDALWTGAEGRVTGTKDRTGLFRAQTPQGFHFEAIVAAHAAFDAPAADDVAVARAAGLEVAIVEGHPDNLKITTAADFARAARILETGMDVRLGNGFDVHAFGPGDHVTLCGIRVTHDRGLVGHSDADVGMHAVTDALYGAQAKGDIGQHFPPSDPQWKGAASAHFLRHAADMARSDGFAIANIDCTLICEQPKIGPHAPAMRAELARIAGVDEDRISVKATTSERLGFTGRGEGIACIATATLVRA
ncbi:bifunctional 2-C-methyl-D-erythritol 4-phosphate cytidylyltransferase/2-C-methyl-D-erythritol 2,4-cyclodiphosphate synthase [Sulfitobacter sp. D35]|uniref:bifunctional 2-C-methyl-D-erythritol 4-phosphate cytidylyltransferase/2-C-methyl-D-erythritol 2,4-cyclodiphosphate synthase n=1 Tax=Sulfitobacter sp. D35 TaxID=3083252 RepID=UPI00296FFF47|nr:bifunctional 2-C-methyl-D-erythritol 4-phosphate cytidylyltransferase/2-C-methyl-D-erythritol 2,4-cyclodiphosphate synthase [Sulfitobacter sp. D35]MDW4497784.1 bifunctional 2-C-methyl-D-erythritol 4-phosphate cytidylyltransferase/2-C-methyl-D-erythritol 2,4-cyclodiphosphate synthase [Sulfitobacter sp. D35]